MEVETGFAAEARAALAARGHTVVEVPHVGGGMCAIGFGADGMPAGLSGGLAEAGLRFWPDPTRG